jgi:hypothetical protein
MKPTSESINNNIIKLGDISKVFVQGFLESQDIGIKQHLLTTIIKSLPPQWKNIINSQSQSFNHNKTLLYITNKNNTRIPFIDLTPKTIYQTSLTNNHINTPNKFYRWKDIFSSMNETSTKEWSQLFINIHKNNSNNKADEIKYKLIHFALPTNTFKKKEAIK